MHIVQLQCERERVLALDLAHTALLCIDFQVDFVLPGGMAGSLGLPIGNLAAALPAAQRVLAAARAAGLLVIHTREAYAPDLSDLNAFRRRHDSAIGKPGPLGRFLVRGESGTEIVPQTQPSANEPVIDKPGFSAFHQSALDTVLRARNIEMLLLMGFTTQCCVASTLRAAVDLGYGCALVQDACAAYDPADHDASVRIIYSENHNFGWVTASRRVEGALAA